MRFQAKFTGISTVALLASALAISTSVGMAPAASAHAVFVASSPAKNSVVTSMPKTVSVRFDDKIIEIAGKHANVLSVTDSKGHLVSTGFAQVTGSTDSTAIKSGTAKGRVTVSWRVVSDDGHPVTGIAFFTLK